MFATILFSMLAMSSVDAAAVKRAPNPGFDVQKVRGQMMNLAGHSWEWGTASEALLEWDSPALSVFGTPFPVPSNPSSPALDYARQHIFLNGQYLVPDDGKSSRWRCCFRVATDGYLQVQSETLRRLESLLYSLEKRTQRFCPLPKDRKTISFKHQNGQMAQSVTELKWQSFGKCASIISGLLQTALDWP